MPGLIGTSFATLLGQPVVGTSGWVALYAVLDTAQAAILFYNDQGGLSPALVDGMSVEVAPGDDRIISGLPLETSSMRDSTTAFNASAQLALRAGFDDGTSGILVATPVPEPAPWIGLALGGIFLARSKRRVAGARARR